MLLKFLAGKKFQQYPFINAAPRRPKATNAESTTTAKAFAARNQRASGRKRSYAPARRSLGQSQGNPAFNAAAAIAARPTSKAWTRTDMVTPPSHSFEKRAVALWYVADTNRGTHLLSTSPDRHHSTGPTLFPQ